MSIFYYVLNDVILKNRRDERWNYSVILWFCDSDSVFSSSLSETVLCMCDIRVINKIILFSKSIHFFFILKINANTCLKVSMTNHKVTGKVNTFLHSAMSIPHASRLCYSALLNTILQELSPEASLFYCDCKLKAKETFPENW